VYVVCATVGESIANSSKWSANHCITVPAAAEKNKEIAGSEECSSNSIKGRCCNQTLLVQ